MWLQTMTYGTVTVISKNEVLESVMKDKIIDIGFEVKEG